MVLHPARQHEKGGGERCQRGERGGHAAIAAAVARETPPGPDEERDAVHRFRHFRRHQRPEGGIERARCTAEQFTRENSAALLGDALDEIVGAQAQKSRLLERGVEFAVALVETRTLGRDRGIFRRCARGRRVAELLAPRIDVGAALLEAFGRRA
jgi:hypothetical protein